MTFNINLTDTSAAILGGSLIAIASTLNLLFNGKITGISGIFFGIVSLENNSNWKLAFLNGMLVTSCFMKKFSQKNFFNTQEEFLGNISLIGLIISAFLVGFGTKLGNGCTSGHGVCGMPRLSLRSIVAVCVFMSSGVVIATLRYHFPFFSQGNLLDLAIDSNTPLVETSFMIIFGLIFLFFFIKCLFENDYIKAIEILLSFLFGCIFSAGLIISGMCKRTKILDFLTISYNWDISLLYVMITAVIINFFTFYYIIRIREKPIINDSLQLPKNKDINLQLIIGSLIFGIGWGIGGLCPGPALVSSVLYIPHMMIYIIFLVLGQFFCVVAENIIIKWIKSKLERKLIELK